MSLICVAVFNEIYQRCVVTVINKPVVWKSLRGFVLDLEQLRGFNGTQLPIVPNNTS